MKFVYGKQDWKTFERGEENCFLMTNGLGGFSAQTMIGSCSRNDHALLMACAHSPNHRYNMIHRLEEVLHIGEENVHISSQDQEFHKDRENGYLYQSGFTFEDYPQWTYLVKGIEVKKTVVLGQGSNTVGVSYEIRNRSAEDGVLEVIPHMQFVPKGELLSKEVFPKEMFPKKEISSKVETCPETEKGFAMEIMGMDARDAPWQEPAPVCRAGRSVPTGRPCISIRMEK